LLLLLLQTKWLVALDIIGTGFALLGGIVVAITYASNLWSPQTFSAGSEAAKRSQLQLRLMFMAIHWVGNMVHWTVVT
jgi:hypothetical protein